MSNVDRIAQILRDQFRFVSESRLGEIAADIDAALHPVIETVEQLVALPVATVIKIGDGPGGIYEKDGRGFWGYSSFVDDGAIPEAEACAIISDPWRGPIRVLWTPEADR